jgi:antitoxin component YwqK of YwqJK toxin-antitoxin module
MSSAKFILNGFMILGLLIPHISRALPVSLVNADPVGTIYCIQIAASKTYISPNHLKTQFNLVEEVLYFEKDGWYKYVIGPFPSINSAQSRLYKLGIEGFVTSIDSSALRHEGDDALTSGTKNRVKSQSIEKVILPKTRTVGEFEIVINGKKELYEGEFITDLNGNKLRDGSGKSTNKDGSILQEGEWVDNSFTKGTKYNENGVRFVGEFKNNELSGQGSVFINGKLAFSGIWKDGNILGEGTAYYPNGVIAYKGEFTNMLMDGHGTSYKPDGTIDFQGEWKGNNPVKQ